MCAGEGLRRARMSCSAWGSSPEHPCAGGTVRGARRHEGGTRVGVQVCGSRTSGHRWPWVAPQHPEGYVAALRAAATASVRHADARFQGKSLAEEAARRALASAGSGGVKAGTGGWAGWPTEVIVAGGRTHHTWGRGTTLKAWIPQSEGEKPRMVAGRGEGGGGRDGPRDTSEIAVGPG